MIHLDTSFLIRALVPGSTESRTTRDWLGAGEALAASAVVWGEFLCGPVDPEAEELAMRVVTRHSPLTLVEAREAAWIFNRSGRRRGSFQDCLVAATAVVADCPLATSDRADFERFVPLGLQLAG